MKKILTFCLIIITFIVDAQTVTDFDGNIYDEITIGDQTWLQQNLSSLHYSDGTDIPDVLGYEGSDSLVLIYGRLYTWDAAMRGSNSPMVQGVCPEGWHVPSSQEWVEVENYLGGSAVAGGAMKATGTDFWDPPNTGATNSSGFSALAGGEFDTPNGIFQLLLQYAVFWTSTEVSSTKARERYLSYNSAACEIYDWHKSLNYSIRCVKDETTGMGRQKNSMINIFPNPTSGQLTISITETSGSGIASFYNNMSELVLKVPVPDISEHHLMVEALSPGLYILQLQTGERIYQKKLLKTRN